MKGIVVFFGMNVGGAIGWYLGALNGFTTAVVLSMVFSGIGLYVVRKLAENYLE